MKLSILAGSTSQTINVFIADSSSTTGAGLTGLAYNTSSLTAYYALPRANPVQITLATQTVTGAFSSGGFVEISSSNMPGWYRLDLPDAALASGRFVSVHLKGATNMAPCPIEIELTAWNNQDGTRGGMAALPNAAAEASGGLVTRGTGTGQISVSSGAVIVQSGTGTGQISLSSGTVTLTDASITAAKLASDCITAAKIATGAIDADAVATDAAQEIADALLDRAAGVETGITPRQAMRLFLSALVGKLSGAGTTTIAVRDVNDSKDRITAQVDSSGNRTSVTLDVS